MLYKNIHTKICIICPEHGEFTQKPLNHAVGEGCPKCVTSSKGEQQIKQIFEDNNIIFEQQVTFNECTNIYKLPFDFYLPIQNILIEYDGIQHFQPVDFFGGYKGFLKTKSNDSIKTLYCEDKNIELLHITYKDNI